MIFYIITNYYLHFGMLFMQPWGLLPSCLNPRLTIMEKTGGLMISSEYKKRWYLAFAAIHSVVASRSKPAICLGFKQTRDISFN